MDILALLRNRMPGLIAYGDFSFAEHTTIGCGGGAAAEAIPQNAAEAEALLSLLEAEKIPYFLLGAGANTLPREEFFEGVVVRFSAMRAISCTGNEVVAGAGVTGGALLRFARAKALSGFEPFAGIPTTVGGGTAMNAGIRERHFGDLVKEVFAVEHGKLRRFTASECNFSEKDSVFLSGIAIVRVRFCAAYGDAQTILSETAKYRARRHFLPSGRSMGCVFVNPEGDSAGRLIEACGLKGLSVGGARVAAEHANFILNEGGTAEDVAALTDRVKAEVFAKTGILLREEIRRVPSSRPQGGGDT